MELLFLLAMFPCSFAGLVSLVQAAFLILLLALETRAAFLTCRVCLCIVEEKRFYSLLVNNMHARVQQTRIGILALQLTGCTLLQVVSLL